MDRDKFIKGMKSDISFDVEQIDDILAHSIVRNGKNTQNIICMEELAELQQQISKHLRGKKDRYSLLEEMADCYICLRLLALMYRFSDDEVGKAIGVKVQREKERLE